ncbi:ArsR/SmtB family transcription factor [Tabrizicola caldifontis]|uniref:ArsR/SmtB family transcription factor n=1 Tax=Tabrizicola caldifontis TaxID=2528036 RepID=UPI001080ED1B|nr:metalloregulator ArsR/SmtB family transcription factor [Rhodobacter sp. YIM 73028]
MTTHQAHLHQVFGALSDPTRLAVVEQLVQGPASVSQLSRPFSMARPTFLKHLQVLENAGMVTSQKAGRVRTFSLSPDALDWVEAWVRQHRRRWERRLNDLGTILDEENNR